MWREIGAFFLKLITGLAMMVLGEERQKREQAEADNETLKKFSDIDREPDKPSPFGRMRDK